MFFKVNSLGLFGMNAFPVTAEISTSTGAPKLDIVGLPDLAVQESKMRIGAAMRNSGVKIRSEQVVVNLAPAGVRKSGSFFDLPILVAMLAVNGHVREDISDAAFFGEISLGGELAGVNGAITMAVAAHENGVKRLFLPKSNAAEAAVIKDIEIYGVENVRQLFAHLGGTEKISPEKPQEPTADDYRSLFDFSDVKGQSAVKRAAETAAAGFHNLLMIGPPGTGKSMIAKRISSILPPMSFAESIETTQIHSVAGMLDPANPLVTRRPFRDVSHTASAVGLIGGGSIPKPGEISLAHNGVLFLDELPEFDRKVLETLRQPLENGEITISRASGSVKYPCNIMMVAAMNPCPCGNFGAEGKKCSCSERQVASYLGRISRPVLDRIDIQIGVMPVEYKEISAAEKSESSAEMLERVLRAQEVQKARFKGTAVRYNSQIPPSMLHEVCVLSPDAEKYLSGCFDKAGLSARAYDRILKVARTVADLDGSDIIEKRHISRAVSFRSLDRKYWGV